MVLTANGEVHTHEEAQVFVHDPNLFVTVQLPAETLLFYLLENSAKTTDIPMSGPAVKRHDWPKMEKCVICKTDNFVPLVVPGL